MAIVGVTRTDLREQAVATLIAAGTDAGNRVYSPRAWPQRPDQLPALVATTPSERKESLGPGIPRFNSVITLAMLARVQGHGKDAPTRIANAETALEALCDQAERAIMCTPDMVDLVQEFRFVETHMVVSTEGEHVIGEGTVIIGCEVPQDYVPDVGDPLTDIVMTVPPEVTGAPVTLDSILPQ